MRSGVARAPPRPLSGITLFTRGIAVSINIADYDPRWPVHFRQVSGVLAKALGELAIRIEHVGSTAVPGLAAKPILDIDVVVRSLEVLPMVVDRMKRIGYEHQGDLGITARHAFKSPPDGPPRHVYVCPVDSVALREHLVFRDHLRQNPQDAEAYAALKRTIAQAVGDDRVAYAERKTEFVRGMLSRCADAVNESTGD